MAYVFNSTFHLMLKINKRSLISKLNREDEIMEFCLEITFFKSKFLKWIKDFFFLFLFLLATQVQHEISNKETASLTQCFQLRFSNPRVS